MSRDVCKLPKGAQAPSQVKLVNDGEDNPLHALHVHNAHHRPGPSSDLDTTPLNHIGRPKRAPEGPRTGLIDDLGVRLDSGVVSPPDCAKQVAW
jgi:hypothetical protein